MRRDISLFLSAFLVLSLSGAFSGDVVGTVNIRNSIKLEVDSKSCKIHLTITKQVHRVLVREFGNYEILTYFNSAFHCDQMKYYVGKNYAPWVAIGDFNGDGRKDLFLRVLWGKSKRISEVFLISEGKSYKAVKTGEIEFVPGESYYLKRPAQVFSPCSFEDRFEYGFFSLHFPFDCLEMYSSETEYFAWIVIYTNGTFSEIVIFLGD